MEPNTLHSINVELEYAPCVNFSFQQNSIPVLRTLKIRNTSGEALEQLRVCLSVQPEISSGIEREISSLPAEGEVHLSDLKLLLDFKKLSGWSERILGEIQVEVFGVDSEGNSKALLSKVTYPLHIYAWNEWTGLQTLPEILAAFVTPNIKVYEPILSDASNLLAQRTGDSSLNGYQSGDKARVFATVGAIYDAVLQRGIRYSNPPASFETTGQKVRFADGILEHQFATCLDISLFFAGLMEKAGLHPILLLHEGHAYCGCWLREQSFNEPAVPDLRTIRKHVEFEEIVVFEGVGCMRDSGMNLQAAIQQCKSHLQKDDIFQMALDIKQARASGIRPLPLQHDGGALDVASIIKAPDVNKIEVSGLKSFSPELKEEEATSSQNRLDHWKQQLLDLTLRNRLLNFRETKQTVQVVSHSPADFEDAFSSGKSFRIEPSNKLITGLDPRDLTQQISESGDSALEHFLQDELKAKRLRTFLSENDLSKRLLDLFRTSRVEMQESGSNTLFLAIGMLEWKESSLSDKSHKAPILLLPVELQRKSVVSGFTLKREDADPLLNVTLMELLRKDYSLSIPGLDPLPEDENGIDVPLVLRRFQQAVLDLEGWEVHPEVWLGRFSFNKFLLWKDLQDRLDHLTRNSVVNHLIHHAGESFDDGIETPNVNTLDERFSPEELMTPLSADSSQLAAVAASGIGKNYVLYGPPGTGKSQTIANIIVHNLMLGRTVLFVAEKRAALEVVHHRLDQLGLAPFCLELHSNKTGKTDVLRQFGQVMDLADSTLPEEWEHVTQELALTRNKLNKTVKVLHQPGPAGMSPYACAATLVAHAEEKSKMSNFDPLVFKDLHTHTRADFEAMQDLMTRLMIRHKRVPAEVFDGLKVCEFTAWHPNWETGVFSACDVLSDATKLLQQDLKQLQESFGFQVQKDLMSQCEFIKLCLGLNGAPSLPSMFMTSPDWKGFAKQLREKILPAVLCHQQDLERLQNYNLDQLRQLDLGVRKQELSRLNKNPSWFNRIKAWRLSKPIHKARLTKGKSSNLESEVLRPFLSLVQQELTLEECRLQPETRLGTHWIGLKSDVKQLEKILVLGDRLHQSIGKLAGTSIQELSAMKTSLGAVLEQADSLLGESQPLQALIRKTVEHWNAFDRARTAFRKELSIREEHFAGAPDIFEWMAWLRQQLKIHQDQFRNWAGWQQARQEAVQRELSPVLKALETGELPADKLKETFDYLYHTAVMSCLLNDHVRLREFFGEDHEQDIRRFIELDDRYLQLTARMAQAQLSAGLPRARRTEAVQGTELGTLQRERTKKRRHKPVRMLLQEIPSILPKLKPCLMMSPLSVAQYLDAEKSSFDLVIFDEASQIPVWDAVGVIARGKQIIVAGDPKQLPPTNFFGRSEDDESALDNGMIEDQESILDECMAAGIPCQHLNWHYRSRDESLIAFSNRNYYEDRLFTFPAADTTRSGVHWEHVPKGHYDKGRTRTNREEGKAVVTEIISRLTNPLRCHESIGVVTFSQAQQDLIENLLDEARRSHPELEPYFDDESCADPVFVKNLENVQGDERDVIFFSVGYGPDAGGTLSMNFGPLNRAGGERRLNVAVTRARKEVRMFSTLRPEQIDLSRSSALGVAHLKAYLEYAARGPSALGEQITQACEYEFDSPFEEEVCRFLERKEYHVHTQVGCSGYRIDLAIADPDAPGRYWVGIECDGATYHRSSTARDRDRLRQSVLESLGWQMVRVWSSDWWNGRKDAEERLLSQIEDAVELQKARLEEPEQPASMPVASEQEALEEISLVKGDVQRSDPAPPETERFDIYPHPLPLPKQDQEIFYHEKGRKRIIEQARSIIEHEGPITEELLIQRVMEPWGFGRIGVKIRSTVVDALDFAKTSIDEDTKVYWPKGVEPENFSGFRVPDSQHDNTQRDPEVIPGVERRNVMIQLLEDYGSMPEETLLRETLKRFGKRTLTTKACKPLNSSLDALEGKVLRENGTVVLGE